MKNIEKYENEISQLVNDGDDIVCSIATVAGIVIENSCSTRNCKECQKECLKWMYSEYKGDKDILTDQEKEIVKLMIDFVHKCGSNVIYIRKHEDEFNGVYVYCELINKKNDTSGCIYTPWLSKNLFKGLKNRKEYTLEELGLENVNG